MLSKIRVASRTSALAMTQTKWVIARLQELSPDNEFDIVPVVTKGDKIVDVTLSKVGGKGLFVSEIEETILSKSADLAVHSLKDVPAELAPGLTLSAFPVRADARDAWISKTGEDLRSIRQGARVGTSSLRRVAQLRRVRPDLDIASIRGNIDTRLRKMRDGEFDAIVLAAAGLQRMGWEHEITAYLEPEMCLPAVGQGILGIECRADDTELLGLLSQINDELTHLAAIAERSLLFSLNGSCQVPIAGYAVVSGDKSTVRLRGLVASVDGHTMLTAEHEGSDPVQVGLKVAADLREHGADVLLAQEQTD
nr:hydroxymethylbilane synthase [Alicyclobacillus ferrooxydans]